MTRASFIAAACWRKVAVSVASVTWIMTPAGRSSVPEDRPHRVRPVNGSGLRVAVLLLGQVSRAIPVRKTRSSSARHPFPSPSGTASANGPADEFLPLPSRRGGRKRG